MGYFMTYKQAIKEQCEKYAQDPRTRFIGYNTSHGSRMYGTLDGIAVGQCIEAPVAENLMVGLAIGMCLERFCPVVCFERHDFMLLAMDALVNHVDKLSWISGDQFKLPIIVRAIVGSKTPMDPGPMHSQNYATSLRNMLKHTPVLCPTNYVELKEAWEYVGKTQSGAVVIVEFKDDYAKEIAESH